MKLSVKQLSDLNILVRNDLRTNKSLRAGQSLFNQLYNIAPELANSIRGTAVDPFYRNDRIKDFFKEICDEESYQNINPIFKQLKS